MQVTKCDNGCGRYSDTSPGAWSHTQTTLPGMAPTFADYCQVCGPTLLPPALLPAPSTPPAPAG
ncbi:MAG: hypothetical protein JWM85_389 [Acidimicrobiaceae bacterium]|nr:hypothetical protein [Acidimicrobiaceae bacterium]